MQKKTYLTEKDLLEKFPSLGSLSSIRQDRHFHRGLPYIKFKSKVLYDQDDVIAHLERQKVTPEGGDLQ